MTQHDVGAGAAHQLARADIVVRRRMRLRQDFDGGLRIAHGEPRRRHVLGRGPQLQHGLGDDPERALGAHEQMLQVVARIVLLERAQAVPDVAVGQYDLQAHHQVARIAVAQHLHAAGIGREVAADQAGTLCAEAERKETVVARRGLLQRLQDAAGLDGHRIADRVDLDHLVHAAERQQDATVRGIRRGAAHQPGVAALRHDRDAMLEAEFYDLGDFLGRCRPHHDGGGADQRAAPVAHERLLALVVQDQPLVADDGAQAVEDGWRHGDIGDAGRG
jgi:hypothetical protein